MTLRGAEYLTYDLVQRGVDPILSHTDEVTLHFRTRKSNGLLFYTGEYSHETVFRNRTLIRPASKQATSVTT